MASPKDSVPAPKDPRWYRDGLRFDCTACGNCCRDHGEYTFVYVSDQDLTAMSAELGISPAAFDLEYCEHGDGWRYLKRSGNCCVFLDATGLCKVYEGRPKQCKTWPLWQDNLVSSKVWNGPVKKCCPGLNAGELTSADDADRIARETEEWYEDE